MVWIYTAMILKKKQYNLHSIRTPVWQYESTTIMVQNSFYLPGYEIMGVDSMARDWTVCKQAVVGEAIL